MKRFTLILALVLMVLPMMAGHVNPDTARKAAETFMQTQTGTKVALHQIEYADKAEFPHFYVFGTENSFVIISADDCVQPVLGYSIENPFGTEKMPENVFCWLKGYEEQIADAEKSGQKASSEVAQQWKELLSGNTSKVHSEVIVDPLIQTQWDQGSPYNNLCPPNNNPKLTGCVATAMAQIMKYWQYPTIGFGSHSYTPAAHPDYGEQTANFGNTTYDWASMTNTYSSESSDVAKAAVAKLMYHCGVSVNMNYGSSGNSSGSQTYYVVDALKNYFNYSQTAHFIYRHEIVDATGQEDLEQWENMLKTELNASRPIQYSGSRINGDKTVGHSFICDGYEVEANSNIKFHFNWGWSGQGDGSFAITSINYPLNQGAIFGIQPISYNAQPNGLEALVSGQNVCLTWTAVNNASSYNVYRNYVLIGNTGTNISTFTDNNAPIGNHSYFVRGVDGEGNVSLPSNIANANVQFNYSLENLTIEHLELSYQNGDATLQWAAPYCLQYLDYYDFEGDRYYWGPGAQETFFWGARFPASILSSGTSLTSVSTDFKTAGQYTLYIYRCLGGTPSGDPVATVTNTFKDGWNTIAITPAVTLDNQNDLWIVFKSTDILWPFNVGEQNADDGNYYSSNGTNWKHLTGYSYFISANLTDGNFTYNIYDNGNCVAESLNTSIHTLSNISSNTAHQYTVKTKLGDDETQASNMAGVTVGTASLASLELGDNDNMTIAKNSKLTVSGTLSNGKPENLILEDGAQLIHSGEGVKATVKKDIDAWTTGTPVGGWYFIALPIDSTGLAPDSVVNMLTDENEAEGDRTYDLYRLENNIWKNYRKSPFDLANGEGYLYANEDSQTLAFMGTVKPYKAENNSVTVSPGWNLIGNPYTRNVVPNLPYHTLNNGASTTPVNANEGLVTPGMGIAVYSENGGTLSFNLPTEGASASSNGSLQMILTQQVMNKNGANSVTIDNAIINFNENEELFKFNLLEANSKLYIPKGDEEYAIVSVGNVDELPVNFKAAKNGTYTLGIESNNLDLDYLHLIDNMTGANIDLLETTSYTFEAKTSDYASRFSLVFNDKYGNVAVEGDDAFAFVSDGHLQILNQGEAQLQIFDIMGRTLSSETIQGNYSKPLDLISGVYTLRLSNAQTTRTQKIVVR